MSHAVYKRDENLGSVAAVVAVAAPAVISFISGLFQKKKQLSALKEAESDQRKIAEINAEIQVLDAKIKEYQDEINRQELFQRAGTAGLTGGVVVTSLIIGVLVFRKYKRRKKR